MVRMVREDSLQRDMGVGAIACGAFGTSQQQQVRHSVGL